MKLPEKNFIIYDGDCGFCQKSMERLKKILGDKIDYIPSHSLDNDFYGLSNKQVNRAIRFVEHSKHTGINEQEKIIHYNYLSIYPDLRIYSAAYAIFKALSYSAQWKFLLWLYLYMPLFAICAEAVYSVIARYRSELSSSISCKIK